MKILKKALALTMALVMSLTLWMPVTALSFKQESSASGIMGVDDYAQYLYDEGYPVFTTQSFAKIVRVARKFLTILTGRESRTFNLTMDSFLSGVSNYVCENSGLDMGMILGNLPDITVPQEL